MSWLTTTCSDPAYSDANGILYTRDPIKLNYQSTEHGRITQLSGYGDSRQRNHGVDHVDIEGTVTPAGTGITNGKLARYERESHGCAVYSIFEPGFYVWTTGINWTGAGLTRMIQYDKYQNGAVSVDCLFNWAPASDRPENYFTDFVVRVVYDDRSRPNQVRYRQISFREWYNRKQGYDGCYAHLSAVLLRLSMEYTPEYAMTGSWESFTVRSTLVPYRMPISSANLAIDRLLDLIPEPPVTEATEKDLYKVCLSGQNCFTSNGIAYAMDVKKVGDSIRALLALIADPASPKAWASAWLSMRFGDRLQAKDSIELLHSVQGALERLSLGLPYRETHAQSVSEFTTPSALLLSTKVYHRGRLRCSNESYNLLMTSIKKFMDWDVWLTLENAWDLIPLSFVVDWFLNLQSILSNIDAIVYEQYLRVHFYERSDKAIYSFQPDVVASAFGLTTELITVQVTGKRYYRRSAVPPRLSWADGWEPGLPSTTNYVDGLSLIVQFI